MAIEKNITLFHEINSCEVCGNRHLKSVLKLGSHPMCDDLIPIGDSRKCREYPIEILFCEQCCTAHQRFQVPKHDLFPETYHYRSRFTADVLNGMDDLVDSCEHRLGSLTNKKVLDIGCNDGSLLDYFRNKGAMTFGIEPTGACKDAKEKGHTTFNHFLSEEIAVEFVNAFGKPDIITFTNVFAHIENLQQVLSSLNLLMADRTVIVIENHYLGAVFARNQFDTFYHEHPRTYSYTSFTYMANTLNADLLAVEFPVRYGGNIRVFIGNYANKFAYEARVDTSEISEKERRFLNNFHILQKNVDQWVVMKKQSIASLIQIHGKLRAKAFPGRAAILIKLLELDEDCIEAVYEKPGSLKIGHYLPGTRIPIHSDVELFNSPIQKPLLNLAWHIPAEIRNYLRAHGYQADVVDILNSDD